MTKYSINVIVENKFDGELQDEIVTSNEVRYFTLLFHYKNFFKDRPYKMEHLTLEDKVITTITVEVD